MAEKTAGTMRPRRPDRGFQIFIVGIILISIVGITGIVLVSNPKRTPRKWTEVKTGRIVSVTYLPGAFMRPGSTILTWEDGATTVLQHQRDIDCVGERVLLERDLIFGSYRFCVFKHSKGPK